MDQIVRKRWVVMRNNRTEIWCGLSKNFHFKSLDDIGQTEIKTYRSENQALSGCSSWNRDFEAVPINMIIDFE